MRIAIVLLLLINTAKAGEPILPAEALQPILAKASDEAPLRADLERIRAAYWLESDSPAETISESSIAGGRGTGSSAIPAYLSEMPRALQLPGETPPASCQSALLELDRARIFLNRMHELRSATNLGLDRISYYFKVGANGRLTRELARVDAWIIEINEILIWLESFRQARLIAPRDISVEYTLSMRGPRANQIRWSGLSAESAPEILALGFGDGKWKPMDPILFSEALFFVGMPEPLADAKWRLKRLMSFSKYCERSPLPALKIRASFKKEGVEPQAEEVELWLKRGPLFQ